MLTGTSTSKLARCIVHIIYTHIHRFDAENIATSCFCYIVVSRRNISYPLHCSIKSDVDLHLMFHDYLIGTHHP